MLTLQSEQFWLGETLDLIADFSSAVGELAFLGSLGLKFGDLEVESGQLTRDICVLPLLLLQHRSD